MKKLHYSIHINAPREKVWDIMLSDATYREWTATFNPGGSYFEGNWTEGSKILFLGPGEDGRLGGMVSTIAKCVPHEFVSIEHLGQIDNGIEDTTSERVKAWSGAHENYTFTEKEGETHLTVDLDTVEEYVSYMEDTWPKALQKLKALSEK
jgi:uncharacterized protein YndB with AHSA1/START domain